MSTNQPLPSPQSQPLPMPLPLPAGSGIERRRGKRVKAANPMKVRVLQSGTPVGIRNADSGEVAELWLDGILRDISMTGVGIECVRSFPVGSILHVKILYNEPGKSYEVYGKVMWVREKAMGLKFVKVDPGSLHVGR